MYGYRRRRFSAEIKACQGHQSESGMKQLDVQPPGGFKIGPQGIAEQQDGIPQKHARDNQRSRHQEIEQLFKTKAFLLKQKSAVVTEGGAAVPVKTGNKLVVNLFRKP